MSPVRKKLSAFDRRFVSEYLIDLNGAGAYRRAGGTAERSDQAAYELLRKPEIAEAVQKLKAKQLANADLTASRVLEELRRCAFVQPKRFFRKHLGKGQRVSLIPITELSDEDAAAIAGFEIVVENAQAGDGHMDYVHKVKFVPKIEALAQLAKRFGLDKPEPDDSGKEVPTFVFPPGTEINIR